MKRKNTPLLPHEPRLGAYVCTCALFLHCGGIWAEQSQDSKSLTNVLSTSAKLDFTIKLGKFLFFRVGEGSFPNTNATIDSIAVPATFSIPSAATTPGANGNSVAVNWDGAAPSLAAAASAPVGVEVQSNAGQIRIWASVTGPMSSGGNTIPMSAITITSSDAANFPAPPVPASGNGTALNVVGTAFGNRVTNRTANWSFSVNTSPLPAAGSYTGQITFTATSP